MKIILVCFLGLFTSLTFGQQRFNVFFDFNKDFPNEQSIAEINKWITGNKEIEIVELEGYCDPVDAEKYNKKLAERRIENIQNLLEKNGIQFKNDLKKSAFGEGFKQSINQAENRRVTILYRSIQDSQKYGKSEVSWFESTDFSELVEKERSELASKFDSVKKGDLIRIESIKFYMSTAIVVKQSKPLLKELLQILLDNPNLKIEIQGHICCQSVFDYSGLSFARARKIYEFLDQNKIDRKRMTYKGYGTYRPVHPIPEQNPQEEYENRRVEILIVEN